MVCDGFIFNREDHTKKDLYIELIDFDEPEKKRVQDRQPI